jgi:hypothetical protein
MNDPLYDDYSWFKEWGYSKGEIFDRYNFMFCKLSEIKDMFIFKDKNIFGEIFPMYNIGNLSLDVQYAYFILKELLGDVDFYHFYKEDIWSVEVSISDYEDSEIKEEISKVKWNEVIIFLENISKRLQQN